MPQNRVCLTIDGRDYYGWLSVSIQLSLTAISRSFDVSLTTKADEKGGYSRINVGNSVVLKIGKDDLLKIHIYINVITRYYRYNNKRRFVMRNEEIMTDSQKLDFILKEISTLNTKVKMMEMEFENFELTLKDEIRPNILRVANRNNFLTEELFRVIEKVSEIVLLSVKVNTLENRVRELREKSK